MNAPLWLGIHDAALMLYDPCAQAGQEPGYVCLWDCRSQLPRIFKAAIVRQRIIPFRIWMEQLGASLSHIKAKYEWECQQYQAAMRRMSHQWQAATEECIDWHDAGNCLHDYDSEQDEITAEISAYGEDCSRSDEDGWFYADTDEGIDGLDSRLASHDD